MNDQAVKNMIELALSCEPKAKKKSISLHVDCPDSLEGKFTFSSYGEALKPYR